MNTLTGLFWTGEEMTGQTAAPKIWPVYAHSIVETACFLIMQKYQHEEALLVDLANFISGSLG